MIDREKVISQLEEEVRLGKHWDETDRTVDMELLENALLLLKEQEPREITKEEWESWKKAKYRDPLCMYWRGDVTPFWILRPEQVHEPAYLCGDIKIFNGKPDKEKMHGLWLNSCR